MVASVLKFLGAAFAPGLLGAGAGGGGESVLVLGAVAGGGGEGLFGFLRLLLEYEVSVEGTGDEEDMVLEEELFSVWVSALVEESLDSTSLEAELSG